jgi:hypothetical protein
VPLGVWILIGLLLVASGICVWIVAERTADGRIRRSSSAGIRTRSTKASDQAWVAGHRAAKQAAQVAAALLSLTGIGLVVAAGNPDVATLLMIVGLALSCGALIKATIAASRASKSVS